MSDSGRAQALQRQLLLALLLIVVNLAVIAGGLLGLANAYKSTKAYKQLKPYAHLAELDSRLRQINREIRQNYDAHKTQMRSTKVVGFMDSYGALHSQVLDGERDFRRYISAYRAGTFQLASMVQGSAEWHRFYDLSLKRFSERSQRREQRLRFLARTTKR